MTRSLQPGQHGRQVAFDGDVVVGHQQRDRLPDRRPERPECGEEARRCPPRVPPFVKEPELFVLVVLKPSGRGANEPQRRRGKHIRRQRLQRLRAFLTNGVNRGLDLAHDLEIHRVIEHAPVFKEQHETPDDRGVGWSRIGPLHTAKRHADAGNPARDRAGHPASAFQPLPHCRLLQSSSGLGKSS
ncbi:hypothetical protein P0D84_40340 [Paraburkholderia sp. RL17-337-BIB-A]